LESLCPFAVEPKSFLLSFFGFFKIFMPACAGTADRANLFVPSRKAVKQRQRTDQPRQRRTSRKAVIP
jgi:hypothetical protein